MTGEKRRIVREGRTSAEVEDIGFRQIMGMDVDSIIEGLYKFCEWINGADLFTSMVDSDIQDGRKVRAEND
jgi:hypothetical protein